MSGCSSILVINQPTGNRGDEAAHKAFVRTLLDSFPEAAVKVMFIDRPEEETSCLATGSPRVEHILLKPGKFYYKFTAGALKKGLFCLGRLHPQVRGIIRMMKEADIVVNAPGGMDIGGFRNWNTLFILKLAVSCRPDVSVFGRSIGPFPKSAEGLTPLQKRFDRLGKEVLKDLRYLSLRDSASCREAASAGIPYEPAIDSAFLDSPACANPFEGESYAVLVPNSLEWHPAFKGRLSREDSAAAFSRIAGLLAERWGKVYLLPQLSGKRQTDFDFLSEVASGVPSAEVLPPTFSSEQQEAIIAGAQFLAGARYHSIVFAILGNVPFLALSYEHKIAGMLETLDLTDRCLDISESLPDEGTLSAAVGKCAALGRPEAAGKAAQMAMDSFLSWKDAVEDRPLVSVIVPNYNYARFLPQRLESILGQTYVNKEIILLDDCSTDGSREIMEGYRDRVNAIVLNDTNSGSPFVQWKKGLGLAKGELIWIAESDDVCEADFLEKTVAAFLKDPRCTLSFCRSDKIDAEGRSSGIHPNLRRLKRPFLMDGTRFARRFLSRKNVVVNASSVVFRRSAAMRIDNGYDSFRGLGDHVFWAGMALEGKVAYIPEVLNHFRFHTSNVTAQMKATVKGLVETARMADYLRKEKIAGPRRYRQIAVTALYALKYRCPDGTPEQKQEVVDMFNPGFADKVALRFKRIKRLLFREP